MAQATGASSWSCCSAGGLSAVWVLVSQAELLVGAAGGACPCLIAWVGSAVLILRVRPAKLQQRWGCSSNPGEAVPAYPEAVPAYGRILWSTEFHFTMT